MAYEDNVTLSPAEMDLNALEDLAWRLLDQGSRAGREAFHVGSLCTLDAAGRPTARSMVLRDVDADARLLAAFTDRRAAKVRALREHPHVCWQFYDPRRRLEVRVSGPMTVHAGCENPLTVGLWQTTTVGVKLEFAREVCVGERLAEAPAPPARTPTAADLTPEVDHQGLDHFAVLLAQVENLEILHLNHAGHRRARFEYRGRELVDSYWLAA